MDQNGEIACITNDSEVTERLYEPQKPTTDKGRLSSDKRQPLQSMKHYYGPSHCVLEKGNVALGHDTTKIQTTRVTTTLGHRSSGRKNTGELRSMLLQRLRCSGRQLVTIPLASFETLASKPRRVFAPAPLTFESCRNATARRRCPLLSSVVLCRGETSGPPAPPVPTGTLETFPCPDFDRRSRRTEPRYAGLSPMALTVSDEKPSSVRASEFRTSTFCVAASALRGQRRRRGAEEGWPRC